jgi:hypothetical protein
MSNINKEEVKALVESYIDANERKNKAASDETKALKQLEKIVTSPITFDIKGAKFDSVTVGEIVEEVETIDPVDVAKKYPDIFMKVVNVVVGRLTDEVGDTNVQKLKKTTIKQTFKVVKNK